MIMMKNSGFVVILAFFSPRRTANRVESCSLAGLSDDLARQPVENWKVKIFRVGWGKNENTGRMMGYDGTSLSL